MKKVKKGAVEYSVLLDGYTNPVNCYAIVLVNGQVREVVTDSPLPSLAHDEVVIPDPQNVKLLEEAGVITDTKRRDKGRFICKLTPGAFDEQVDSASVRIHP